MIRFIYYTRYPSGVSAADGDKWYFGQHLQDLKKVPGVQRLVTWKAIEPPEKVKGSVPPWPEGWPVRRSDLWFDDYKAWEASRKLWVAAKEGQPGFGGLETIFVPVEVEYDLLRDCPPLHIKYITMPMIWRGPGGKPPDIEETDEFVVYSYLVGRFPDQTELEADEWYMGHHTREGKQLPGMKHYRTWRAIKVPEQTGNPLLQPNKHRRLTELGMSFNNFHTTMLNREVGIQFTGNPRPSKSNIPGLRGIYIKLEEAEEPIKLAK